MPKVNTKQLGMIIAQRRKDVAAMYLRGYSHMEIANHLGVSTGCVHLDLRALREHWLTQSSESLIAQRAIEVAKIDMMEAECWQAWIRSTENAQEVKEKVKYFRERLKQAAGEDQNSTGVKYILGKLRVMERTKETIVKGRLGDTRLLERISWCIETRCKIFGIIKPDSNTTNNFINLDWDKLLQPPGTDPLTDDDPIERRIREVKQISDQSSDESTLQSDAVNDHQSHANHITNPLSNNDANSNQQSDATIINNAKQSLSMMEQVLQAMEDKKDNLQKES